MSKLGFDVARSVFQPPLPPTYSESLEHLFWINNESNNKKIPAVFLEWKGSSDNSAHFTILYANTTLYDMGMVQPWLKILRDTLHVNVLCFEYSGYGLHAGFPSEASCYEDIREAYNWLTVTKGFPIDKIIVYGASMGSGPAIDLVYSLTPRASGRRGSRIGSPNIISQFGSRLMRGKSSLLDKDKSGEGLPTQASGFAGLILQSPLSSVLALDSSTKFHVGFADMFDNIKKASRINCPILVAHGDNDTIIPKVHSKKLCKKFSNLWKFLELEGVGHHDIETSYDYLDGLLEFVEYLLPSGATIKTEIVIPKKYTETPQQVVDNILNKVSMGQYTPLFLSQGYMDPLIISSLDEIDIMGMGIDNPDHVKAVCEAIGTLKAGLANASPLSYSSQSLSLTSSTENEETEKNEEVETETETETEGEDSDKEKNKDSNGSAQALIGRSSRSSSNVVPITQIESQLRPYTMKYEDMIKEKCLRKGFFEELYVCVWGRRKVVARNMPSKQSQRQNFLRQAAALLSLKHDNLLLPIAVCIEPPNLCIVTEYMEKGSLYDMLHGGGHVLEPSLRAKIGCGIAEALAYLHSQNPPVVHRDITSRNVLLDGQLNPRVGEFGLQRPPSFLWMAPEVFTQKRYAPASDVFSLGI